MSVCVLVAVVLVSVDNCLQEHHAGSLLLNVGSKHYDVCVSPVQGAPGGRGFPGADGPSGAKVSQTQLNTLDLPVVPLLNKF